ncbi:MAG: hypothetical protein PVH68_07415 [Armatimonadota bacterium]
MPEREKSHNEAREPWFVCDCIRDFLRSPVGRHLLNARRELLLAARACVDTKIERVEKLLQDDEARQVPVE